MNLISEDYLMHHGVKGMKWGVRHDPELNSYGAREDAKAYKYNKSGESGWKGAKRAINSKVGLSNNQKKIAKRIAIGAAVVGAAGLAAYGKMNIRSISLSPEAKEAFSKGAKYLRMGKTDAKIMKIGLQDALGNSKAINKGKSIISSSKLPSNISRKARMAKTDAKIVKIGTKDVANSAKNKVKNQYYWTRANRSIKKMDRFEKKVGRPIRSSDPVVSEIYYWYDKIK